MKRHILLAAFLVVHGDWDKSDARSVWQRIGILKQNLLRLGSALDILHQSAKLCEF